MVELTEFEDATEYVKETHGIRVSVVPAYIAERSEPSSGVYVFAYRVQLENLGAESAQLVNRHWIVMSGGVQTSDVKGEGVVGEQPVLSPGVIFEYTSWSVISEPMGSMFGTYTLRNEKGEFFDVEIPRFELVCMESSTVH